ncbi:unnamed protein product [Lymnaea stagnalis]|uniref:Sulfotransferase domain-containing protein n=1 Tax=Lymnaea stagnalis TaxID=6523 RepID=A0AAV2IIV4_LYMST
MLVKKTVEYDKRIKDQLMLEFVDPVGRLGQAMSPRVLSSHFVINHLPQEIISKKTKIIHLIRNPKDTVVSMYYFYSKNLTVTSFPLSEFLTEVIADNLFLPNQFDFLRQITEFEQAHPDQPIKHIHYEDMKKDPLKTILDLAQFLDVPASETFCQQIAEACSFDNMKKNDDDGNKEVPQVQVEMLRRFGRKKMWLFRKGIIGDWKNELTEEQVQELDDYIDREEKKGLAFKFVYE